MKVLLINGSPHVNGNTYTAIKVLSDNLNEQGIETEIYNLGNKSFLPCTACSSCFKMRNNTCIIDDDLNGLIQKCLDVDGIVLASPVHYADVSALAKCAFDRLFYVSGANKNIFKHKVGASIAVVRRTGGMQAFNTLNTYLSYSEMFVVGSSYWNVIHGRLPGEVLADNEGIQTLQTLGDNMTYLLKTIESSTIERPIGRKKVMTNFIREDLL